MCARPRPLAGKDERPRPSAEGILFGGDCSPSTSRAQRGITNNAPAAHTGGVVYNVNKNGQGANQKEQQAKHQRNTYALQVPRGRTKTKTHNTDKLQTLKRLGAQ